MTVNHQARKEKKNYHKESKGQLSALACLTKSKRNKLKLLCCLLAGIEAVLKKLCGDKLLRTLTDLNKSKHKLGPLELVMH